MHGRTPTVAEMRACIEMASFTVKAATDTGPDCRRGIDNGPCYDEECTVCDPTGAMNA